MAFRTRVNPKGTRVFTTRPELVGDHGMVASTHWLASATGMSVLERGGNAFDAAVAAGFVLQVVEPHLNGPGGEVPILLWDETAQEVSVVCGQGVAPAAATIERFADLGLALVPGTGPLAATVPGAVGGWLLMLERWGTWRLADVLEPAIGYADRGFPVVPRISEDIGGWTPTVERPVTYDYRGHTVCKTGPWGQGPVFLQQLALLSGFDLDAAGFLSADYVHTVIECAKLAFADREAWYGDPDHVDVPLEALLGDDYAKARRELVGAEASMELRPGSPDGRAPVLVAAPDVTDAQLGASGEPTLGPPPRATAADPVPHPTGGTYPPSGDTCHVDVVDRHGNMVAATPSGGWLQSSPTIPELGFCLGTRAQMFWLRPGLPSSLRPGSRPRTTLTPSLALRAGRPWMAFGTPGGDQQDQWTLNFFLSVVHGGLNLQAAIDAPMFHSAHFPSSFYPRTSQPGVMVIEDRVGPTVIEALRRRGHDVQVQGPWTLGRLSAVARDADFPAAGFLRAAANPRGAQGYAAGR